MTSALAVILASSLFSCWSPRPITDDTPISDDTPIADDAPVADDTKVVFETEPIGEGNKSTTNSVEQLDLKLEISFQENIFQTITQKVDSRTTRHVEVLKVNDNQITQIKVTYPAKETKIENSMEGKNETVSPLAGKSFIIERTEDGLLVKGADDAEIEEKILEEVRILESEHHSMGSQRPAISSVLKDGVAIGQEIDVAAPLIEQILGGGNYESAVMKLKLRETRDHEKTPCGIFDVVLSYSKKLPDELTLSAKVTGEMIVGVKDSWIYGVSLKGPVTLTGKQDQGDMTLDLNGKGPSAFSREVSYGKSSS